MQTIRMVVVLFLFGINSTFVNALPQCNNNFQNRDALIDDIKIKNLMLHLQAFEKYYLQGRDKTPFNGRVSGTLAYDLSFKYVVEQLKSAGYQPVIQNVPLHFWMPLQEPKLSLSADGIAEFQYLHNGSPELNFSEGDQKSIKGDFFGGHFLAIMNSPSVKLPLTPVAVMKVVAEMDRVHCKLLNPAELKGKIALSTHEVNDKVCEGSGTGGYNILANLAYRAGAKALVLDSSSVNRAQTSQIRAGSIPLPIPMMVLRREDKYAELLNLLKHGKNPKLGMELKVQVDERSTYNVYADSLCARSKDIIMIGGHLDSVFWNAGIADDAGGVAMTLELAKLLAHVPTEKTIRFHISGGEELGLIGMHYYAEHLSPKELARHKIFMNAEIPSADNGGATFGRSDQSAMALKAFNFYQDSFAKIFHGKTQNAFVVEPPLVSARTDCGPLSARGVPCTVIATGFEAVYGALLDPKYRENSAGIFPKGYQVDKDWSFRCYHQVCDDVAHVNQPLLEAMAKIYGRTVLKMAG